MFRELSLDTKGRIFLHSMPARLEPWSDFLQASSASDISHILCLTSRAEIAEKSPCYALAIAQGDFVEHFIPLAVKDFSIPVDQQEYANQMRHLAGEVTQGAHLLIHCAAGIGRTGCAAMAVLKELGFNGDEAKEKVLAAGSTPETAEQWAFIQAYQVAK